MAYKLYYKGGPRDSKVEDAKGVHSVIFCDEEAQRAGLWGSYRLGTIKGQRANMVWKPHPKPVPAPASTP